MFQFLINFLLEHNIISIIFYKILYMSVVGSFVGILILIIRKIFDKKISPKWKCIMWGILLITLLIPFRFELKTNFQYENKILNNIDAIPEIAKVEHETENIESLEEPLNSNLLVSDLISQSKEENTLTVTNNIEKYNLKDILYLIIIPYAWLFITVSFILSFIFGYLKITNQIKNRKCNDIVINEILKDCLKQLNIKKNIKLYYCNDRKSASIFGILNSKILISKNTLQLDDDSLRYIFMHELAHYKRKDLVLNFVMLLMISLHFFNPIAWYSFKKMREDIELAADECVIRKMDGKEVKQYGLTLIHMLELNQTNNYAINFLCMSDTEKNMERRIKMIKNPLKNKIFSAIFVITVIALISSIVFIKSTGKESVITTVEDNINKINQNYEHIWTEPKERTSFEEYEESIKPPEEYKNTEVSDEEKQNLISEEDAKKIGKEIVNKIGYTDEEIKSIKLSKHIISAVKYSYELRTTNGLYLYINAENGEFSYFRYDNLIKQKFENEKLSDEELKTFVLNLYKTFAFLNQNYEFYSCSSGITAMGVGDVNSSNYKQYTKEEYNAIFYERQASGILDKYKKITINFYIVDGKALISAISCYDDIKANSLYHSSIEYIKQDNKVEISEDMAIKIAEEKDSAITNNKKIKKVRTELINNMTNYEVWAWENGFGYEDLSASENVGGDNNTITTAKSYPKYYYDKYYIRNTYEVVLIYDVEEKDSYDGGAYNGWLGKVYYIDATTGEILGGRELSSLNNDIILENEYLFDEDDNYTCYKTNYYDGKTKELIYEDEKELPEDMKKQFYIKKDEKPNPVSYNIY